jgi:hypothetical protein
VKHFKSLLTPGTAVTAVTAVKPTTIQNMVLRSEDT